MDRSHSPAYWLMKTEPSTFSFSDLLASPEQTSAWDGVRNYQARNFMRRMVQGDIVFFYHSSTAEPGIVGLACVRQIAHPDPTQFDPSHTGYDPNSSPDAPRWSMVSLQALRPLQRLLSLSEIKNEPTFASSPLIKKGNRLSVLPISPEEAACLLAKELLPR